MEEQQINRFMKLQKNTHIKWTEGKTLVKMDELDGHFHKLEKGQKLYIICSKEEADFWTLFDCAEKVTDNFKIYRIERGEFIVCEVWKDGRD